MNRATSGISLEPEYCLWIVNLETFSYLSLYLTFFMSCPAFCLELFRYFEILRSRDVVRALKVTASDKYKLGTHYTGSELTSLTYPWAMVVEDEGHWGQKESNAANELRLPSHVHPSNIWAVKSGNVAPMAERTMLAANADAEYKVTLLSQNPSALR